MRMNKIYTCAFMTLAMALPALPSSAQDTIRVEGLVVSHGNRPVANVSVSMEGSLELPVVTDSTGTFSLGAVARDRWIIVAPASGYKRKRIYLESKH